MTRFCAIIEFDESVLSENRVDDSSEEMSSSEYIRQEFGWLEQSGIYLQELTMVNIGDERGENRAKLGNNSY